MKKIVLQKVLLLIISSIMLFSLQSCSALIGLAYGAAVEASYGAVKNVEKNKNEKLALTGSYANEFQAVTTDSFDVTWDRAISELTKIDWISLSSLDKDNGIILINGLNLTKMTVLEKSFDGSNAYVVSAKVTRNMNVHGNFYIHLRRVASGTQVNARLINLSATDVTSMNILNYPVASTGVLEKYIGSLLQNSVL
ncbi:MAG: hypothetical protein IJ222_00665 [Bacteroidales bacterium]|nr:hypothetical protein [Bacteroidales bacterium]